MVRDAFLFYFMICHVFYLYKNVLKLTLNKKNWHEGSFKWMISIYNSKWCNCSLKNHIFYEPLYLFLENEFLPTISFVQHFQHKSLVSKVHCNVKIFFSLVNIALNKPANLQHPLIPDDNTHNASNAVDGRKSNLTWDGGQCSASAARETATWWVNLTDIHSIHHIAIYYMVGQRPWGISIKF